MIIDSFFLKIQVEVAEFAKEAEKEKKQGK